MEAGLFKVLVLIQGHDVPASRYRILQYLPYLEEHGMTCQVVRFPKSPDQYYRLCRILPDFDCVFIQKKRFHFPFLGLLRQRAKRIVYDFDDAVMYKDSFSSSPYSRTRQRRFANMVGCSDHVIAGNSFLEDKARAFTENVSIIPTALDTMHSSLKDYGISKDRVTIGWIGSHATIHYLELFRDVWEEIGKRYPSQVELKIICDTFFDCEHIPVRKVNWSKENEQEDLKSIDIGVMPLSDDLWSWGKCGLKILQYYSVGVPAVCTPVGVNRDVVLHNVTGYWAETFEQWVEHLGRLIEDPCLRQQMGVSGRDLLDKGYTVEVNAPRLLSILHG